MPNIKIIKETEYWFQQLEEARAADKKAVLVESPVYKNSDGTTSRSIYYYSPDSKDKFGASKHFWEEIKDDSVLDLVTFNIAFKDELIDLGLKDLFELNGNYLGKLKSKSSYGQLKTAGEANPNSWAIKAAKKLWSFQFGSDAAKGRIVKDSTEKNAAYNTIKYDETKKPEGYWKELYKKVKNDVDTLFETVTNYLNEIKAGVDTEAYKEAFGIEFNPVIVYNKRYAEYEEIGEYLNTFKEIHEAPAEVSFEEGFKLLADIGGRDGLDLQLLLHPEKLEFEYYVESKDNYEEVSFYDYPIAQLKSNIVRISTVSRPKELQGTEWWGKFLPAEKVSIKAESLDVKAIVKHVNDCVQKYLFKKADDNLVMPLLADKFAAVTESAPAGSNFYFITTDFKKCYKMNHRTHRLFVSEDGENWTKVSTFEVPEEVILAYVETPAYEDEHGNRYSIYYWSSKEETWSYNSKIPTEVFKKFNLKLPVKPDFSKDIPLTSRIYKEFNREEITNSNYLRYFCTVEPLDTWVYHKVTYYND